MEFIIISIIWTSSWENLILTHYLLVSPADNLCEQFGPRSWSRKRRAWSRFNLFDTEMVFRKSWFWKKNQQTIFPLADPGILVGGGVQVNLTKEALTFFLFFLSSAYFTEVKWLISKKTIIFQGSGGGLLFPGGGSNFFQGGVPIAYSL